MNEKAQDTVYRKYFEQESWRLRTHKKRIEMLELRREQLESVNKLISGNVSR